MTPFKLSIFLILFILIRLNIVETINISKKTEQY